MSVEFSLGSEEAILTCIGEGVFGTAGYAFVDVDDTIIEVHGHAKQGAGFGYTRVRGLNALIATLTTAGHAPLVVAQRLRKGSCGSPRGAKRLVGDAVKQARRLLGVKAPNGWRLVVGADV